MQLRAHVPSSCAGRSRSQRSQPCTTSAPPLLVQLQGHAPCSQQAPANRLGAHSTPTLASRLRCASSQAQSFITVQTASLPELVPLNDDYERRHTFGDFANWLVPGSFMVGRYPYVEPSRCQSHDKGEAQLEKIIEQGINTFISLQAEVPPQDKLSLAGKNGFLPYKATAELIKSAHSPPPSMEVMMNLRNPTLDKFLPAKKRKTNETDIPSYQLNFDHFPITDLSIPEPEKLLPFIQSLADRLKRGEKLYMHCWGGRGRVGTVAACFLAYAYGLSEDEALQRVQRAFNTRQDTKESSPETAEQFAFVRDFVANLRSKQE